MVPACRNGPHTGPRPAIQRMRVDVDSHAEPEPHRDRYLALDAIYAKP